MKIEDLLSDPSFRDWADGKSDRDTMKWDAYLDDHPEDEEMLLTAREMLRRQPFSAARPEESLVSNAWSQTQLRIRNLNNTRRRRLIRISAAAAIGLILVSMTILLTFRGTKSAEIVTISTGPGEVRTMSLGDGSVVTLNGNSEIEYPGRFSSDVRSVSIKGEAFFEVNHLDSGAPFVVNTNEYEVTVRGTSFNVNARRLRPSVSLVEGTVDVKSKRRGRTTTLKPGQTAEFKLNIISVINDDVQARISWKQQLWTFDDTPLSEVLISLQETFNVRSTVDDDVDIQRTISGKFSVKNLRTFYKALEAMLDVEITQEKYGIVIQKRQ